MSRLSRLVRGDRAAGRWAVLTGALMAASGAIHATRPDLHADKVERPVEHAILVLLAGLLVLAIPPVLALGRRSGTTLGRRASMVAVTGQVALAITCTVSNVNGGDPDWFIIAAPLSNLLWAGGWIALAVALGRSGTVQRWIAIGLPLTWIALLPGSSLGGGLLAGGFWIALGTLMVTGGLAPRATATPVTAGTAAGSSSAG
ncbi:MAG: hypothetical protein AB7V62_09750 [Thermoleophilia bacterium]